MIRPRRIGLVIAVALAIAGVAPGAARGVEVTTLAGFEELFGRYAPGGDCARKPQIVVERGGLTFEVPGDTVKVSNPEYAASYGPHDYDGISKWFFPFRLADGYAILMTFNADEKKGALHVTPHDEGYAGGPPLGARNKALVAGSPYARCK